MTPLVDRNQVHALSPIEKQFKSDGMQRDITMSADDADDGQDIAVEVSILDTSDSTEEVGESYALTPPRASSRKQMTNFSPGSVSSPKFSSFQNTNRRDDTSSETIDARAASILSEARSALSGFNIKAPRGEPDERTRRVIETAMHAKERPLKLRSTREVLQLAGQVLQSHRSMSPTSHEMNEMSVVSTPDSATMGRFKGLRKKALFSQSTLETSVDSALDKEGERHANIGETSSLNSHDEEETDKRFSLMDFLRTDVLGPQTCGPMSRRTGRSGMNFAPWACGTSGAPSDILSDGSIVDDNLALLPRRGSPADRNAIRAEAHDRFVDSIGPSEADDRMPEWVSSQRKAKKEGLLRPLADDRFYSFEDSRTVIVHEIARGDWTWCTAWAPDGNRLAIATENHHLAVVETSSSTIWRVQHDRRISKPLKSNTTQSIRSIVWGKQFIAIGGTGNAVSILAPIEPYPILHSIVGTEFVNALAWRGDSSILAIASRDDRCIVVNVSTTDGAAGRPPGTGRHIQSTVIGTLTQDDWVNAVAFSPGGTVLAVGDRTGKLSLYGVEKTPTTDGEISYLAEVMMHDSILSVEWSSDGKWLYAGGEDFAITIINTKSWKKVNKISRDKWVQFISSSNRGTHVAVGGVASEVTVLDVKNKWTPAMSIELKGLVPLSATWHPQDRYLVLTGQTNNVVAIETTDARHIGGHCIRSVSPILGIEFSPDGRMVAIGNESGVISVFRLTGSTFVMVYELVILISETLSIEWSPNGKFVVVGSGDSIVIIEKAVMDEVASSAPPNTSGFFVKKVIRGLESVHTVSIDDQSRFVAVSGDTTRILDAADNFTCIREWKKGFILANSWSPDGTWLASIGKTDLLTIYDTRSERLGEWRLVFSIQAAKEGHALAWAPSQKDGPQYLAYGGMDRKVTVIEIRTQEESWEKVIEIPRDEVINDLDWNPNGLLAIALGNGTVSLVDLAYLQSGRAVNEMDYNWQRQGITCFTEIRRNKSHNSMRIARWMPFTGLDYSLLAVGGSDGAFEIIDLTERKKCKGFLSPKANAHGSI